MSAVNRQPQRLPLLLLCLALAAISYAIHHHAGWEFYFFISWPPAYKAGNFRQKWIAAYSGAEGAREARAAFNMPRYQPQAASELHTYIVSLPGDGPRRRNAAEQMKAHGVQNWFFFDAINGSQALPETEVNFYSRGQRLQRIQNGVTKTRWHTAALITHLRLMHKLVAEGREAQIVLEDDFELVSSCNETYRRLNRTLHALPADWSLLWLNHGPSLAGGKGLLGAVGEGIQLCTNNYVSLGIVYTRQLALMALNEAQIGDRDFDNVIEDLGKYKALPCYVACPPLMRASANKFPSNTEVAGRDELAH